MTEEASVAIEDTEDIIMLRGVTEECVVAVPCPRCSEPLIVVAVNGMDECVHCGMKYVCLADEKSCGIRPVEITEDPIEYFKKQADSCKTKNQLRELFDDILEAANHFENMNSALRKVIRGMYTIIKFGSLPGQVDVEKSSVFVPGVKHKLH